MNLNFFLFRLKVHVIAGLTLAIKSAILSVPKTNTITLFAAFIAAAKISDKFGWSVGS